MHPVHRLFFATRDNPAIEADGLRPGTLYEHVDERNSAEIARILDCTVDQLGVRHVRFDLLYRYQHKTMEAGERTLSLATFLGRFSRRL